MVPARQKNDYALSVSSVTSSVVSRRLKLSLPFIKANLFHFQVQREP